MCGLNRWWRDKEKFSQCEKSHRQGRSPWMNCAIMHFQLSRPVGTYWSKRQKEIKSKKGAKYLETRLLQSLNRCFSHQQILHVAIYRIMNHRMAWFWKGSSSFTPLSWARTSHAKSGCPKLHMCGICAKITFLPIKRSFDQGVQVNNCTEDEVWPHRSVLEET